MLFNILRNGLSAIFGDRIVQGLENSYLDPSGFNAEQAQLDRDWQEQMMHFQNAYSSPEQQMQRARAAGLNPSMLYGQEVATSATPAGGAQASAQLGSFNPLSLISLALQNKAINADVSHKQADVELKHSMMPMYEKLANLYQEKCSEVRQNVKTLQADENLKNMLGIEAGYRTDVLINEISLFNETFQAMVDKTRADAKIAKADAQFALKAAKERVNQMKAYCDYMHSNARLSDEMKEYYGQMKTNLEKTFEILSDQAEIIDKQKKLVLKYGETKEVMALLLSSLNSASQLMNSIASLMSKGQTPQQNNYITAPASVSTSMP